jgi:uncharacterized protein (TIGR02246 family)
MTRRLVALAAVLAAFPSASALADATGDARGVADAFQRAVAAGDADAVVALYADDAWLVWPGAGQEARGKEAIAKLVRRDLPALRAGNPTLVRLVATPLADGTIAVVGHWEDGPKEARVEIRTTEVLVRRDGAWKYLIDHASVGAPPASPRRRDDRRRRRGR